MRVEPGCTIDQHWPETDFISCGSGVTHFSHPIVLLVDLKLTGSTCHNSFVHILSEVNETLCIVCMAIHIVTGSTGEVSCCYANRFSPVKIVNFKNFHAIMTV